MDLLDLARGPGLQWATIILFAGLIWRLLHVFLTLKKSDISEARQGGEVGGGLRTIFSRFRHHKVFRERTRTGTIVSYTMHIGLASSCWAAHRTYCLSRASPDWTGHHCRAS